MGLFVRFEGGDISRHLAAACRCVVKPPTVAAIRTTLLFMILACALPSPAYGYCAGRLLKQAAPNPLSALTLEQLQDILAQRRESLRHLTAVYRVTLAYAAGINLTDVPPTEAVMDKAKVHAADILAKSLSSNAAVLSKLGVRMEDADYDRLEGMLTTHRIVDQILSAMMGQDDEAITHRVVEGEPQVPLTFDLATRLQAAAQHPRASEIEREVVRRYLKYLEDRESFPSPIVNGLVEHWQNTPE